MRGFLKGLLAVIVDIDHEMQAGLQRGGITSLACSIGADRLETLTKGVHGCRVCLPTVAVRGDTTQDAVDDRRRDVFYFGINRQVNGNGCCTGFWKQLDVGELVVFAGMRATLCAPQAT